MGRWHTELHTYGRGEGRREELANPRHTVDPHVDKPRFVQSYAKRFEMEILAGPNQLSASSAELRVILCSI